MDEPSVSPHRVTQLLDPGKPDGDYFATLLAQLTKVRVPTGEGAITQALEIVSKLADSDLPVILGYSDAPKKAQLLAALHRELSRRSRKTDKAYFLSYRDAAKVCNGLSHQEAHTVTFALVQLGVIEGS